MCPYMRPYMRPYMYAYTCAYMCAYMYDTAILLKTASMRLQRYIMLDMAEKQKNIDIGTLYLLCVTSSYM